MSSLCWIFVIGYISLVASQDVPLDLTQSLLAMLQDEKSLNSQLETELTTLTNDLNSLKNQLAVSPYCANKQQPVAFSAALSYDINSFGVRQQIHFDQVITNVGNAYDKRHGEFTAPVNGTYEFTVSMVVVGGYWVGIEIVKDGVPIGKLRTGDSAQYTMASTTVNVEMMKGEDVWVEHLPESDSNKFYGKTMSTFSGHLIRQ
ncbi:hypothetical protein ACF0H5_014508 [Mactra antiquata]